MFKNVEFVETSKKNNFSELIQALKNKLDTPK